MQAIGAGHIYLPKEMLLRKTAQLISVEESFIEDHILELVMDKKLMIKVIDQEEQIYLDQYYFMELNVARMLTDLNIPYPIASLLRARPGPEVEVAARQPAKLAPIDVHTPAISSSA